jgi:hypothetical protein
MCDHPRGGDLPHDIYITLIYMHSRQAISRLATAMYDAERKLAIAQTHGRPQYAGPSAAAGTAALPLTNNPTGFQPATTAAAGRGPGRYGRPPIPGTSQFSIASPTAPPQPGQSAPAQTQVSAFTRHIPWRLRGMLTTGCGVAHRRHSSKTNKLADWLRSSPRRKVCHWSRLQEQTTK